MRKRARVALALVCARTPGLVALEVAGVRRRAPLASGLVCVLGRERARACARACARVRVLCGSFFYFMFENYSYEKEN